MILFTVVEKFYIKRRYTPAVDAKNGIFNLAAYIWTISIMRGLK